jgi:hypothetical protein
MRTVQLYVATELSDLEALPVGSRILTNHDKVFELDQIDIIGDRKDAGEKYWIEPGTLQPFPLHGLQHWLPAYILPKRS